jgi:hypothetical protein
MNGYVLGRGASRNVKHLIEDAEQSVERPQPIAHCLLPSDSCR